MDELKTVEEIKKKKIIAILRGVKEEQIEEVANALYEGGIRFAEVPFDQKDTEQNAVAARLIERLATKFEGRLTIGAGTVCKMEQLHLAIKAGAKMIVAPNVDEEIIRATKAAGLISVAGAFTPTEMLCAHKYGADLIKIFPSSGMSLKVIREIAQPLNHLNFLCFGGVKPEDVKPLTEVGVVGFGVGGGILDKEALKTGDYERIRTLAKDYVSAVE